MQTILQISTQRDTNFMWNLVIRMKYNLRGDCKPYPHNVNLGTFFSETNKHRTMKLYIATIPLSMHKLCFFFVNIGEN